MLIEYNTNSDLHQVIQVNMCPTPISPSSVPAFNQNALFSLGFLIIHPLSCSWLHCSQLNLLLCKDQSAKANPENAAYNADSE
jgi:hypothetical protein